MADDTPLLWSASSGGGSGSGTNLVPSLDSIIEECVGDLGLGQLLQALVVCFAWFFDAQQTFIAVFTDANPKWHRTTNHSTTCDFNNSSNICQLNSECWAWDSPPHFSIVSEWNLQCAPSFFSGLPSSSFFLGCLLGGFSLATLADSSLGRKNTLLLSSLIMSFSSLLTAFSPNLWIYSAFRFLSGFGRANLGTCALVLSTELIGKRWRSQVGVSGFFAFTFGFVSLPLLAYASRSGSSSSSWRSLYIWTSIPLIVYSLLLHFLVRESPRWLFVQGRKQEAVTVLESIASANHGIRRISFSTICNNNNDDDDYVSFFSAIRMLFGNKWCVRRVCGVMTIALGTGMTYYGMPLGLGDLGMNLYLSVTLNAVSELPAALFTLVLIGRWNRKGTLVGFTMVSGICSVLSVTLKGRMWEKVQMGLELVSFFSACTVVNVLLMFTIELFPTCVRNSAVSLVRQGLVIGGVLSPMLVVAGRKNEFLSYGVFGIVIASCGAFAVCLPETKGRSICDTMDEEQNRFTPQLHPNILH